MDKFIKYICRKSKFCTNFEDDHKSSVASFYYNKLIQMIGSLAACCFSKYP